MLSRRCKDYWVTWRQMTSLALLSKGACFVSPICCGHSRTRPAASAANCGCSVRFYLMDGGIKKISCFFSTGAGDLICRLRSRKMICILIRRREKVDQSQTHNPSIRVPRKNIYYQWQHKGSNHFLTLNIYEGQKYSQNQRHVDVVLEIVNHGRSRWAQYTAEFRKGCAGSSRALRGEVELPFRVKPGLELVKGDRTETTEKELRWRRTRAG